MSRLGSAAPQDGQMAELTAALDTRLSNSVAQSAQRYS